MTRLSNVLATRDNKGKIRIASISMDRIETDAGDLYVIHRSTGLSGGKQVQGPDIEIFKGKAKRTTEEQATLQYNALVKEYKDKGYKEVDVSKSLEEQVPIVKQDQAGAVKPMLCKVIDFEDKKLLGKTWYINAKHDGLRITLYYRDGKVHTASRGGSDYDIAAQHIINDPIVISLFADNPSLILDGELYRHGWPLEKISGLGRLDSRTEDHDELSLHCYDIVDESMTCEDRYKRLDYLKQHYVTPRLFFVPYWVIEPQTDLKELKKLIMEYHDKFTSDGYEGAVIRDKDAKYKCGGRDRRMLKIKLMDSKTFKIIGYELGLRGVEDMCFIMETPDKQTFKAKPVGSLEIKQSYIKDMSKLINKPGDVQFFRYKEGGIPNLPIFLAPRLDLNDGSY